MLKKISVALPIGIGTLLLMAFGCKVKKDVVTTNNEPFVSLDTITITPRENPKAKIYRASNTRTNDIVHTKLEVSFDWENQWLLGKATIDVKPYFYPTKTLWLNARGMDIYKVQLVNGTKYSDLKYTYENDSLRIELDQVYRKDMAYKIFIDYKSKPEELKKGGSMAISSDKGLYFINPKGEDPDKMPQIWTQGETQSNSAWFPTIDSPNEKMTEEIYMTVDDKYVTLSNGVMTESVKNANGTRTDHWKMDLPHAPYLVMMAVGEFKIVKDTWKGKDVWYYVEKEFEPHAKAIFGNTPEMLEFFSNKLGVQYAWPKYSQVVVRDYVSGAMENTSATLHGEFLYSTTRELLDADQEDVIAHELFHQWFGDLVTCESWSNLPLNESFATYGEYLWNEYKYGRDEADAAFYRSRGGYLAESSQKMAELVRFEYKAREDMFDGHSYNKGGQILNMLRRYVGDDAFFASLKLYLERYRFQAAEMHMLRLCFEEVTGEDLNWFFNEWCYSKGHPSLKVENTYDEANKTLTVRVIQQQDFSRIPLFKLPVNVDIYDGAEVRVERIWITEADQKFVFKNVNGKPKLVNFDSDKALLCEKFENKTLDEYIFQYKNAPLYLDRYEALEYFKNYKSDPKVYEVVKLALNDKFDELRTKALGLLGDVAKEKESELRPIVEEMAKSDKSSNARAEAIDFLSENYPNADLLPIYTGAMADQSYRVIGSALSALAKSNPKAAIEKAKTMENETTPSILFAVMDIYSKHGTEENNEFFMKAAKNFGGFAAIGYYNMYGLFLKKCSYETAIKGSEFISQRMKGTANKYVKFYAQKAVKDQVTRATDEMEQTQIKIDEAKKAGKSTADLEAQMTRLKEIKTKLDGYYTDIMK